MATPNKDRRRAELAKIHLAAKQLGMNRGQYEAVLWTVARVESAKDLDAAGRAAVLEHMKSRGFKSRATGRSRPGYDRAGLVGKIRAMLMHAAPPRPDAYADRLSRHMYSVERFEWCTPTQLRGIIAALAKDGERRFQRERAARRF